VLLVQQANVTLAAPLLFTTDNTRDIGAAGATRPRDLYVGRNALVGGTLGVTGDTTLAGNLALSGTAKRLTADWSNATPSNRLTLQTSTPNAITFVQLAANGSGAGSSLMVIGSSAIDNSHYVALTCNATTAILNVDSTGSGGQVPLQFYVNKATRLTLGTDGTATFASDVHASDIYATRSSAPSTGIHYFGTGTAHYLYYDGSQFNLVGGNLAFTPAANQVTTAAIQANAVQQQLGSYVALPSFSTTATNTWTATPVAVTVSPGGGMLRIELTLNVSHSVAGATFYTGLMLDGSYLQNLSATTVPTAGGWLCISYVFYHTPSTASHTYAGAVYLISAGTITLSTVIQSTLFVTEQKR
jgi:hypothetical protein